MDGSIVILDPARAEPAASEKASTVANPVVYRLLCFTVISSLSASSGFFGVFYAFISAWSNLLDASPLCLVHNGISPTGA